MVRLRFFVCRAIFPSAVSESLLKVRDSVPLASSDLKTALPMVTSLPSAVTAVLPATASASLSFIFTVAPVAVMLSIEEVTLPSSSVPAMSAVSVAVTVNEASSFSFLLKEPVTLALVPFMVTLPARVLFPCRIAVVPLRTLSPFRIESFTLTVVP